jgi:hypothetical protein
VMLKKAKRNSPCLNIFRSRLSDLEMATLEYFR